MADNDTAAAIASLADVIKQAVRDGIKEASAPAATVIPPSGTGTPAFTDVDKAAIEAAKAAGVTRAAEISETQVPTPESLHLDAQVISARLDRLEALTEYWLHTFARNADVEGILKAWRERKQGSDVIDPTAKRPG